ncbi:hypothetical protein BD324DRAFT_343415 [Kockovaella imperatae]|uniref:NADH dehydrogenase [ubiquinone] 1 alpha subcomplex subunit n=1 Tax=Kockovaella imperatae TaxID=4999 RepID=A0A1Y1UL49_9TREE|nr:hypothetical protein BD324DRAFT_343415 [Kockovaella imperatae]ORX38224.1 hypothetical protein BD324DRAFT_343415 [Kockovaella imperatae]
MITVEPNAYYVALIQRNQIFTGDCRDVEEVDDGDHVDDGHDSMNKFFTGLADALAWGGGKRFKGRDLSGNKYYEIAKPSGGGRPKRSVKYNNIEHLSDYTSGKVNLPVQWRAWLSHTRPNPPSVEELEADHLRQTNLTPLVAAIEERERAERIRQGYASDSDIRLSIHSHSPEYHRLFGGDAIAGPSSVKVDESRSRRSAVESIDQSQREHYASIDGDTLSSGPSTSHRLSTPAAPLEENAPRSPYPIPTPTSPGVPPPPDVVDPSQHATKEDLRRLSEEDTKRRMAETGTPQPWVPSPKPPSAPEQGVLKPRRRGGSASFDDI